MEVSTGSIVTITEANQNFSAVARRVDARGKVVVFRNNRPAYVIYGAEGRPLDLSVEERVEVAVRRVMRRWRRALEELAK